jgi:DNA-binding winged helix-turn-helix (wHTH) protein
MGAVSFEEQSHTVRLQGRTIHLSRTEYRALEALCARPNRMLSKAALAEIVWGRPLFHDEHNIEVIISRLRRRFRAAGLDNVRIHAIRGLGYRFDADNESDLAPGMNALVGIDGFIAWVTLNVRELLGYHPERLIGQPVNRLVHASDHEALRIGAISVLAGRAADFDVRLCGSDDRYHRFHVQAQPLVTEPGQILGAVAYLAEHQHRSRLAEITQPIYLNRSRRRTST